METLDSISFLKIDGEDLSLKQVLGYLQLSGNLQPFLQEVASQHVIYTEIQSREDLEISVAEFEQAAIDFRMERNLTSSELFQQWLANNGIDYTAFKSRVAFALKVQKLKSRTAEADLETYFQERRRSLDRVDISCAFVATRQEAEELLSRITASGSNIEQFAQGDKEGENSNVEIIRGPTFRRNLPADLNDKVDSVPIGELLGPLEINGRWCLFQVERILPAALEGQVKRELENELFKRWLIDKAKQLDIKLSVSAS